MGMDLPELWQLRYFIAVADRLHFGRAAEALHISQPPLSRAIRALETRLGVALFARSRRRVELTAEGGRLLEEARRLLGQLERAVLEVRGMASGEQGRLRIGFVSLADYGVLPGRLKRFKAARPGVALALQSERKPDKIATVFAGADIEATEKARSYFTGYRPSSPSIALLKDGQLVYMLERYQIEGRDAHQIAGELTQAFEKYCAN